MEKYIDLTVPYSEYDINRYLVNGWRIKEQGATLVILEKENKTYSIMAGEFIKAIKTISKKPENLENLEIYLTYHFPEWLEKFANTPGNIVAELKAFAEMEI
jgi:hypothetical protein